LTNPVEQSEATVPIVRWSGEGSSRIEDRVAIEEPLEIRVRGRAISVVMRTPGHDEDLVAGFLLTEGVVRCAVDILAIEPCGRNDFGNVVNVVLAPMVHVDFERLSRHVFAASSCGLCGKTSIDAVRGQFAAVESDLRVDAPTIAAMPAKLRAAQATFERTGGLHAAALFEEGGELLVAREDVGRHNAVDKVIGHALRSEWAMDRAVLMVSGRASFEIMQKAAAARIAVVAAVSAPSSLAVSFAEEMGQTLLGFVRDGRMNVYTHPGRIVGCGCHCSPSSAQQCCSATALLRGEDAASSGTLGAVP
jgi:FdhD protein